VPDGCGVGWSTSFKGALKSTTWKLFIAVLPKLVVAADLATPARPGQTLMTAFSSKPPCSPLEGQDAPSVGVTLQISG
jgi:hypothetical protein